MIASTRFRHTMRRQKIGYIGGGNMARCLVGGLLNTGWQPTDILVSDPDPAQREFFESQLAVATAPDNDTVVAACPIVVLAIKPQAAKNALLALRPVFETHRPLLVSIVAGVREGHIRRWLAAEVPIVRAMPNTPALVGSGAAGLYANTYVDHTQRDEAESLLRAVGVTAWLDNEDLLDVVTALSGSGPAYFMLFMENLEKAAVEHGLAPDTAHLLTLETCLGAAKLAMESQESLAELRRRVTSPGGTTERALEVMNRAGLGGVLKSALEGAAQRARELGEMLGAE